MTIDYSANATAAHSGDERPATEWGRGPSLRYAKLAERFRPIFGRIAEGAVQRERARELPYEAVRWLKAARFGALRLPESEGGFGATLPEFFELLTELAEADSNLTQIFRAHFGVVENALSLPDSERRRKLAARIADGLIWGGGFTERSKAKAGTFATKVSVDGDGFVIDGEKFYSTGSLFADRIQVVATGPDQKIVSADVDAASPGVTQIDDWDGFGQRLTASGSSQYRGVRLGADEVHETLDRFRYQAAFYQTVHLATLTGIGRAATVEVAALLQRRTRTFTHANGVTPRRDPQILQVVGEVGAAVYAAGAAMRSVTWALEAAWQASKGDDKALDEAASRSAEIEAAQAQVVVARLILEATTRLFDALGASALSTSIALDRFWRNARTLSSHNPLPYKERVVGDYIVNRAEPPYLWLPGEG